LKLTFNLENITGNNLGSLDFLEGTVTENNSLQGKSLLEFLDNRTSLEFLDETNSGVEQEKTANDTKIDPVLKTGGKNGGSLHDELDGTDEVAEELENKVFL